MKHSMLITGKNPVIKDDLFAHFLSDFECLTCSANFEDIKNHLNHFTPDVMVYCLQDEEVSGKQQISALHDILGKSKTMLTIVGSKEDCNFFSSCAPKLAKFVFEKPLNVNMMSDFLLKYFDKRDIDNLLSEVDALGSKKRIMVIDDDPFMLKFITEFLKKDYSVETATSGEAAIRDLLNKSADLILLDYEMPGESGPEVLEDLHNNDATKDIPVIFLTSMMQKEKIEKALLSKPQGYLLKPVNRQKLLEAIENILG